MPIKTVLKKVLDILVTCGAVIIVNLFLFILHFWAIVPLAFNDSGITYMPWFQLIFFIIMGVLPLIVTYVAGMFVVKRLYKSINKIVYLAFAVLIFAYYSYMYISTYQPNNILTIFFENNSFEREYKNQQKVTNELRPELGSATEIITTKYNGYQLSLLYDNENFYFYYKGDTPEKDIIQKTSTEIVDPKNSSRPTLLLSSPKGTIIYGRCEAFKLSNGKTCSYDTSMISNAPKVSDKGHLKYERFCPDTIIYDAMLKERFKTSANKCIYDGTVGYYKIKLNDQGWLELESHIPTVNGTEGNIRGINYYVNGIQILARSHNISLSNPTVDLSDAKRAVIEIAQKEYGMKLEDIHTVELFLNSYSTLTNEYVPCSNVLSVSVD